MKTRLQVLAIVLIIAASYNYAVAQVCFNGISTDPFNSFNNDPEYPTSNNLWINTFDFGANNTFGFPDIFLNPNAGWAIPDFTSTAQFQMFSPFTSAGTPASPFLSQPVFDNRDFHWEDGWELLYLGTGYFPNGWPLNVAPSGAPVTTPSSAYDSRIPYMIYYNRYRGLIRLFAGLFAPFSTVQSLSVDLTMNSGESSFSSSETYSGLLRHLGTYDSPLDVPTSFRAQRGVNPTGYQTGFSFNQKVWYVYDFQVGYDPCTCFNPVGKYNELNFVFRAVQSSTLKLYGRMITLEESIVDAAGNVTYNQDFLTASSIEAQDPNGYILRSSLDGLIEDYRESLKKYNNLMDDRKNGITDWFRKLLNQSIAGTAVSLIAGSDSANWMALKKLNLGESPNDIPKLINAGTKSLIGSGYNFLSNQIFGDNVTPVRPSRPVASFSEMRFSGGIQTVNSSVLAGFWTPGSNYVGNDWTPYNYPAYNEILGMYATLNTPHSNVFKMDGDVQTSISSIDSDVFSNIPPPGFPCIVNISGHTLDSTVYKSKIVEQELYIKMQNSLVYALNQVLDFNMDKTKIYVSYTVTMENGTVVSNAADYALLDDLVVKEDENTNLWLLHDISRSDNPTFKGVNRRLQLNSGWYDATTNANLLFGASLKTTLNYREQFDEFTPLCGSNHSSESKIPDIDDDQLKFEPVRIEIKVMADMYFDQLSYSGEEINTTQVFTYLLFDKEKGIDLIDEQGNYVLPSEAEEFIQMFPGQLYIESPVLTGASPEAYPSNENFTVFVRAEDIIIEVPTRGAIIGSTGPLVKLQAYDEIHLKPGAHLRPNMKLEINKDIYSVPEAAAATQSELNTFCSSATYQAGVLNSARSAAPVSEDDYVDEVHFFEANEVLVYPNPSEGLVSLTSSHYGIGSVEVFDLAGRLLYYEEYGKNENQNIQLDLSSFGNGIYLVKTLSGERVHSHRLVIAH